jgi:hypothetical protein
VALRPCLSTGLPFHSTDLYQRATCKQEREMQQVG